MPSEARSGSMINMGQTRQKMNRLIYNVMHIHSVLNLYFIKKLVISHYHLHIVIRDVLLVAFWQVRLGEI